MQRRAFAVLPAIFRLSAKILPGFAKMVNKNLTRPEEEEAAMTAETTEIPCPSIISEETLPLVGRLALVILGAGLLVASLALWLAPGATAAGELVVMKLGLSGFLSALGICALVGGWGRRVGPYRDA
ncbi:MAG: hypothetical protein CML50_16650 [Rhodobacteraceae bacterium]|uniref:Uncharacterized protein n=2 Tax=Roseobacteraceae TaxID=2854170 RepID=A0A1U7D9F8_9RHOB|nr:hypothetical protein Ga0080559_TMP3910 [Salipiger profundus]MAB07630.1 hypothetical protein [Paracoccaceae bacterium]GFZ97202.1 hypothetical protein GCM10011326_05660 [Salipiger profundus]